MANEEHFKILKQGVDVWNKWREENPESGAEFSEKNLENLYKKEFADSIMSPMEKEMFLASKGYKANLSGINLAGGNLWGARLQSANLSGADLTDANLTRANLRYAILNNANLTGATLYEADLYRSSMEGAKLINTNLLRANLVDANLNGATLENCRIHGTSVWGVKVDEKTLQKALDISDPNDPSAPTISVEDIEVAQFISLLIENRKIRRIVETITSKVVLILGRFTKPRKAVLEAIRSELRQLDYVPVIFDFDKPASKDLTETISTLAHMARFILADITEPKCIPHELATIVPTLSVPVKPLLLKGSTGEYAMFKDLRQKYHWVLAVYRYNNSADLIESLESKVIGPAERKAKALIKRKSR